MDSLKLLRGTVVYGKNYCTVNEYGTITGKLSYISVNFGSVVPGVSDVMFTFARLSPSLIYIFSLLRSPGSSSSFVSTGLINSG